ncbi:MAG: CsbD family protein [Oscillatoria princeps RMCB-10]|nr:CsbD family protein [Oscillatoria princeps RMCB-10]
MSVQKKAKAAAGNFEGQAAETGGKLTRTPEKKAEDRAKQGEADTRKAAEELKEEIDSKLD